jgi:hypothetical protein
MFGLPLNSEDRHSWLGAAADGAARGEALKLPLIFVLMLMPVCVFAQTSDWKRITPIKRGVLV